MVRVHPIKLAFALATLLVASVAVPALAQDGPREGRGGRGGRGGQIDDLRLLQSEKVQKELELVDDQREQLKKIGEEARTEMRALFSGMRDLGSEERRAKFQELRPKLEERQKAIREKVNEILLPQQRDRLKEISIQLRGASALADSEVAEALAITEEQKTKLAELREEVQTEMRDAWRSAREGADRDAARAKMAEIEKRVTEKVEAVLTSEQREKLEKLKGKKADIDRSELRGRGRRGRDRGGDAPKATPEI